MGKKRLQKLISKDKQPSDSVVWDVSTVALVLTAAKYGNPNNKYVVKPVSESKLRALWHTRKTQEVRTAQGHYNAWLASNSALSMSLGTARYLCSCNETLAMADLIGLGEKARSVIDHHNHDCHNHCRDLIHAGGIMPEVTSVMLHELDSSMSNFSLVAACSPQALFAASADQEDDNMANKATSDSVSMASSSTGESSNIYRSPEKLGTNIYLLGATNSLEDRTCIIDDLLVDQYVLANPEIFGLDRVKWLSTAKEGVKPNLSFQRVLQHWCVEEHISHMAITRLLKLLHWYKPQYICYDTLPRTGRNLLKTSESVQVAKGRKEKKRNWQNINLLEEDAHKIKILNIPCPDSPSKLMEVGRYIHFGLEDAITGKSIGLIHRYHYRNLLRRIHTIKPELLPEMFLDITEPEADEPFDREKWAKWLFRDRKPDDFNQEPIVFDIRINADGAQWFESSYIKGTPILGKIVAVKTLSGKVHVKIPYNLAKPFVIGIFQQTGGKPPIDQLFAETLNEMKKLHPSELMEGGDREGACFAVQVVCFDCDGPMRSEMKGTKYSGTYSCDRCKTKGIYIKRGQGEATAQVTLEKVPITSAGTDSTVASTPGSSQPVASHWIKKVVISRPGNKGQLDGSKSNKRKVAEKTVKISRRVKRRRVQRHRKDVDSASDSDGDNVQQGENRPVHQLGCSNKCGTDLQSTSTSSSTDIVLEEGEMADDDEPLEPMVGNESGADQVDCAVAKLKNRHKLAVFSKRKKRGIEEDEGIMCNDDDAEQDDEDITGTAAADVVPTTAVTQGAPSIEASKAEEDKQKKKKKKGKMQGGSTYFPEIGAEKRTDDCWESYKKPVEMNVVR